MTSSQLRDGKFRQVVDERGLETIGRPNYISPPVTKVVQWRVNIVTVTLPPNYKPKAKDEFMNELQQEYFRQKLLRWRNELLDEANEN